MSIPGPSHVPLGKANYVARLTRAAVGRCKISLLEVSWKLSAREGDCTLGISPLANHGILRCTTVGYTSQWSRVMQAENASPWVCRLFYKANVQAMLILGSESWSLLPASLRSLEGFPMWAVPVA